jgi:EAL domain-containing protein (putative c-di-GMP-specific phosphodiesterase class I)
VSELREGGDRTRLVEAIISLGRGLDLPLTAEGVEDEDILNALKSMGRLKAQGYFYGQPEDAEAVRARLKAAGRLTGAPAGGEAQAPAVPEDAQTLYRIARP